MTASTAKPQGNDPQTRVNLLGLSRAQMEAFFLDIGEKESAEAHYGRAMELCRRVVGDDHERTLQMEQQKAQLMTAVSAIYCCCIARCVFN